MEKSKVAAVGREGVAPQLEDELNGENIDVVSFFKHLSSCSWEDGARRVTWKLRVVERLKVFGAMKNIFNVDRVSLDVEKEFDEKVVETME